MTDDPIMHMYLAIGGAYAKDRHDLFHKEGVTRILYSFADWDGKELDTEHYKEVMLDSGAFAIEKSGREISVGKYQLWLELYGNKVTHYINLDDLSDPKVTLKNQAILEAAGLKPLPVWHFREGWDLLDQYCSKYPYVCLGGIAIGTMPTVSLRKFWRDVCSRYTDNKFHILGSGAMFAFIDKPPYSIDNTSWVNDRWGNLLFVKNGVFYNESVRKTLGIKIFFTRDEMRAQNIRALLYCETKEYWEGVQQHVKLMETSKQLTLESSIEPLEEIPSDEEGEVEEVTSEKEVKSSNIDTKELDNQPYEKYSQESLF